MALPTPPDHDAPDADRPEVQDDGVEEGPVAATGLPAADRAGDPIPSVAANGAPTRIDDVGGDVVPWDPRLQEPGTDDPASAPVGLTSGTRVATARGLVAVEALRVGDFVLTADGARRPILRIEARTADRTRDPAPRTVLPVRIRAHAFDRDRPARDLRLAPGHAVVVDILGEVLIPVHALVNGTTIARDTRADLTYWHVGLDAHDLLLAEGLACESDRGEADPAVPGGVASDPASDPSHDPAPFPPGDPGARTGLDATGDIDDEASRTDLCRPFHARGLLVEVVRERLGLRAPALGWHLRPPAPADAVRLVVDGVGLAPEVEEAGGCVRLRFAFPATARVVQLVSASARPIDVCDSRDPRRLGLYLDGLRLGDGHVAHAVAPDDPRLSAGFHAPEAPRRWTDGAAVLSPALWADCRGAVWLRVDLGGPLLPQWVEPEAGFEAERA